MRDAGLVLQSRHVVAGRGVAAKALPLTGTAVSVSGTERLREYGLPCEVPDMPFGEQRRTYATIRDREGMA